MADEWDRALEPLQRIAFDANAIIYLLEGVHPHAGLVQRALWQVERGKAAGVIPAIVEMEILVRPLREDRLDVVEQVDFLLSNVRNLTVREIDSGVARIAAGLRAHNRLKPPDALVGAAAIAEGCDAIIGNDYEFAKRVTGIEYLRLDDYVAEGSV
ncbi:MAG: PIN domain-containing protein [Dehalococcoidia bacterium]